MLKNDPVFDGTGKLIEVSAVDFGHEDTAPTVEEKDAARQREKARLLADYLGGDGPQPAARFMKTGGAAKTASAQPAYKLRQKLADLDLRLRHPHLDRKWRKKVASPRAVQTPVVRGRQGAAKEQEQEQADQ
jgi:hypothetical protein